VSLRKHIRKAKLKKDKKDRYRTQDVLAAVMQHRQEDKNNQGDPVLLQSKREKIDLECQKLKVELDKLRGELLERQQHNDEVAEIFGVVKQGLDEFVQWVTVQYRKPDITQKAKDLRERLRVWLMKKCEKTL